MRSCGGVICRSGTYFSWLGVCHLGHRLIWPISLTGHVDRPGGEFGGLPSLESENRPRAGQALELVLPARFEVEPCALE